MSQSRNKPTTPEVALEKSEEFNDPSADWHISRQKMAQTSLALSLVVGPTSAPVHTFKTRSGKYISIENYRSKGEWIKKALVNQLKMSPKQAEQLTLLMERSSIRAAGFSEQDWQDYYEKRCNKASGDKSWAVSIRDMRDIIDFLKQGIVINRDFCVPFYAGLSDDKKTIYFDRATHDELNTACGPISTTDFVVLHERVEGAMMEQSYLDQLRQGRPEIRFECPLNAGGDAQCQKLIMTFTLVNDQLTLRYQQQNSDKKTNNAIPGMDEQAIKQNVLSYEFGHQIAERLERVAVFASGFGEVWESQYNNPIMVEVERLRLEYANAAENRQALPKETPPGLYILPYAQEPDNDVETYLLWQVAQPKIAQRILSSAILAEKEQVSSSTGGLFTHSTDQQKIGVPDNGAEVPSPSKK